jgi:hypothetical protein
MKKTFIVTKCTESTVNGVTNFYTTISHRTVGKDAFGTITDEKYYIKGSVKVDLGIEVELDLNEYVIEARLTPFVDEKTKAVITRNLNWLQQKAA